MDKVDTLHVGRYMYCSDEVLCCTITAHLRDLEVKVMGHRFSGKAQVRRAMLSCDSSYLINSSATEY